MPAFVSDDIGSLEHEVALSACAIAETVSHVPEILCYRSHREISREQFEFPMMHIREALCARGDTSEVKVGKAPGTFSVVRGSQGTSVSIVIPLRDEPRLLRSCVDSVTTTTDRTNVEIVLVDNGTPTPRR